MKEHEAYIMAVASQQGSKMGLWDAKHAILIRKPNLWIWL